MKTKSKKRLAAAILASLTLAVAAPAFAAANPFVDVPAKHWAYDSVSQLAAAGIIDGYGDGTFRGDRTMTRYEMAQIVAKAMARQDKANAEQKAMIDKLAQEFGDELHNLGVRVSTLENKIGNITWTGQVRAWYEWGDKDDFAGDTTNMTTRLLLWAKAPLNKDLTFIGRLSSWSDWGGATDRVGSSVEMDNAYIQGKNFTFGRQPLTFGQGMVYNIGYNNDGATYTFGEDKLKLTVAGFKSKAADAYVEGAVKKALTNDFGMVPEPAWNMGLAVDLKAPTVYAANLDYQASKDLNITAVYAKSKEQNGRLTMFGVPITSTYRGDVLDTWAIGFGYKGIKDVTITGEYGQNKSDLAKIMNQIYTGDDDDPKAWVAEIKYKGAEWTKPHTYGFWVGYRDAEPGFNGITGDPMWETVSYVAPMNNVKGPEYGFDYTLFNNGVFTFRYQDFESNDNFERDLKSMNAQLRYFF